MDHPSFYINSTRSSSVLIAVLALSAAIHAAWHQTAGTVERVFQTSVEIRMEPLEAAMTVISE